MTSYVIRNPSFDKVNLFFAVGRHGSTTPHAMQWALNNSIVPKISTSSGLSSAVFYGEPAHHNVGGSGSAAAAASGAASSASASDSSSALARSHYSSLNSASALARLFAIIVREVSFTLKTHRNFLILMYVFGYTLRTCSWMMYSCQNFYIFSAHLHFFTFSRRRYIPGGTASSNH